MRIIGIMLTLSDTANATRIDDTCELGGGALYYAIGGFPMYNLNRVTLEGRLTANPEARQGAGKAVCTLKIAVNFHRGGGKEPGVDFIPVVVFGKLAENCVEHLVKGQSIHVDAVIKQATTKAYNKDGKQIEIPVLELWANDVRFGAKAKAKTSDLAPV